MIVPIIIVHCLVSVLLAVIILMQSGRGGGLTEAFASAESIFGAKTNTFLIKATTFLAVIFLVTSLSLAFLSSRKDKSLMPTAVSTPTQEDFKIEIPIESTPADPEAANPEEAEAPTQP